jgi:hypothetical protein
MLVARAERLQAIPKSQEGPVVGDCAAMVQSNQPL